MLTAQRMRRAVFAAWILALGGRAEAAGMARLSRSGLPHVQSPERRFSMDAIRASCPEFSDLKRGTAPDDLRECRVSAFGEAGMVDGVTYYYAIYCLIPNDAADAGTCGDDSFNARYFRERGLVVFERDRSSETARLLFERVSPDIGIFVYPQKPEIVATAAGTIFYLPIAVDGTGSGNASEYFLRGPGGWETIESETWLADLKRRLPADLDIRKGIWPDLRTLRAETALYRSGDANCCPTGGVARIQLAIRSNQFVLASFGLERQ